MNFEFTEEQIMIQQSARDYAQRELIKDVLERDANAEFPTHHVKALAELGFLGMLVDSKYDGGGMDKVSYVEPVAKARAAEYKVYMRAYKCEFCPYWHLTHHKSYL